MTTRREIVTKCGAGLAAIIAAGKAPAAFIRSMIGARNELMAGKRLPYDAEVEYLESTGTQWIDTGIVPNGSTDFSVDVRIVGGDVGANMFGCRDVPSGRPAFGLVTHSSGPSISIARLSADAWNDLIPADNSRHEYSFRDGVAYFDGMPKGTSSGSVQLSKTAFVFQFNNNGTATGTARQRIFGVRFWQSGALVRDLIPVRKGTVGYMYDRVSGRLFGNEGTGDFVLGPDVVPVEYLGFTGTQWIDTGIPIAPGLYMDASISIQTAPHVLTLAGTFGGVSYRFWLCTIQTARTINCGLMNNAISTATISVDDVHDISAKFFDGEQILKLDGTTIITATNTSTAAARASWLEQGGLLLGVTVENKTNPFLGNIYAFKLYNSDHTLVRSFRPVRVGSGSTWKGAMMDVLTRRIYRNAGTGAFTYGNDLKYPIPAE